MRGMDDAFRQQLETAEKSHREELAKMTNEKQREVDMAEQRVGVLCCAVLYCLVDVLSVYLG